MLRVVIAGYTAQAAYQAAKSKKESERQRAQARREQWEWEDVHLLPTMAPEAAAEFRRERQRLEERRQDIERQEQQHRELVAADLRRRWVNTG